MPRCLNCPSGSKKPSYYTGKENNPKGLGYCPKHDKPGHKRHGRDGKMYRVSNNRWVLLALSPSPSKKSPSSKKKSPSLKKKSPKKKSPSKKSPSKKSPRMMESLGYRLNQFKNDLNDRGQGNIHYHRDDQGNYVYEVGHLKFVYRVDGEKYWEIMGKEDLRAVANTNLESINILKRSLEDTEAYFDDRGFTGDTAYVLIHVIEKLRLTLDHKQREYDNGKSNLMEYPDMYMLDENASVRHR